MGDPRRFNLEGFKQGFRDGARANLFYYIPNFPAGVSGAESNRAMFLVKTASLPATTIEEVAVNWQGYDFKYAGKHTYSDFSITFNVDAGAGIRMVFEDWINERMHNPETNQYHAYSDYMVDQKMQLLGYDGTPITEYTLHDAWPKEVGAIELDYSSNEIATFTVNFAYSYHTYSATGSGE